MPAKVYENVDLELKAPEKPKEKPAPKKRGRRPNEAVPYSYTIQIRVTDAQNEAYVQLGSASWIRNVLNTYLETTAPRTKAKRREEPDFIRALPTVRVPLTIPLVAMSVPCGFPSPAGDYIADEIDLNEYIAPNPEASYIVKATGDSMIDAGIMPDDLLVVDRTSEPRSGDIVLAYVDGSFTIKRFRRNGRRIELHPENAQANYPVIVPKNLDEFQVFGVVVTSITRMHH